MSKSSSLSTFQELDAWKAARKLRQEISRFAKKLPADERFRLVDQLIRSSRSVTANIAEGYGRFYFQENIQYCRQARGSLSETLDHLICALDENYISEKNYLLLKEKVFDSWRILNGYIRYLKTAGKSKPQPH